MNAPQRSTQAYSWPPQGPSRAPYWVYSDDEIYAREQARIYRGETWGFLGLQAEIPKPGDFKSTFIGDTPVVIVRGDDGAIHGWVNRCAHRGALVCRELRGNAADRTFTCVYHQWSYDTAGNLVGVPFRKGLGGKGGYPADFELGAHGLRPIRIDTQAEAIFGTFSDTVQPLADYLGEEMCGNLQRVLGRPIRVLGHSRQYFNGNWKLYAENARDSYHGGLLHLFYPTFGIYRQGQKGWVHLSPNKLHMMLQICKPSGDQSIEHYQQASSRKADEGARLQAPEILDWHPELGGEVPLTIQTLFPSVVVQQISNTLAVRQILPKAVDRTELVWTYYGFEDDSPELTEHRLKQFNMVGPAGFISMEDGEAVELCQRGVEPDPQESSVILMGGESMDSLEVMGVDENAIRGFWKGYREIMGL